MSGGPIPGKCCCEMRDDFVGWRPAGCRDVPADFVVRRIPGRKSHDDVCKVGTLSLERLGEFHFAGPRRSDRGWNCERDPAPRTGFQRAPYRFHGVLYHAQRRARVFGAHPDPGAEDPVQQMEADIGLPSQVECLVDQGSGLIAPPLVKRQFSESLQ